MTTKQRLGTLVIGIILACTCVSVAGIWGFIGPDDTWKLFGTLVTCAIGLGTAAQLIDVYFKDKAN